MKGVLQLADAHSLNMGFQYATKDSKNENVGDFALPERASRTQTQNYVIDLREISILSERTVHDVHFIWRKDHSDTNPFSNALAIIVKDAFNGGGAQNKRTQNGNEYELSNLIYFAGEKLTMRSGFQGWQRRTRSFSEDNFYGEFTFSDLASFRAGKPLKYRITCCDPSFEIEADASRFLFSERLQTHKNIHADAGCALPNANEHSRSRTTGTRGSVLHTRSETRLSSAEAPESFPIGSDYNQVQVVSPTGWKTALRNPDR